MISSVNPDDRLAHKSFENYLLEGPIAALNVVEAATGAHRFLLVAGVGRMGRGTFRRFGPRPTSIKVEEVGHPDLFRFRYLNEEHVAAPSYASVARSRPFPIT